MWMTKSTLLSMEMYNHAVTHVSYDCFLNPNSLRYRVILPLDNLRGHRKQTIVMFDDRAACLGHGYQNGVCASGKSLRGRRCKLQNQVSIIASVWTVFGHLNFSIYDSGSVKSYRRSPQVATASHTYSVLYKLAELSMIRCVFRSLLTDISESELEAGFRLFV